MIFKKSLLSYSIAMSAMAMSIESIANEGTEQVHVLDTIVVTASGTEQTVKDAPASISIIEAKDIANKGYLNIHQALENIEGVSLEGGPGARATGAEISIRGFDSAYTLLLVNGVPQGSKQAYYNGHGTGMESGWLPPIQAIERIEVIRGPMSSLYGSSALGGVVNIITKDIDNHFSTNVGLNYIQPEESAAGAKKQLEVASNIPLLQDKLFLTLNGQISRQDEDGFAGGYHQHDRKKATAKLTWKATPNDVLSIEASQATQHFQGNREKVGNDLSKKLSQQNYTLHHKHEWNRDVDMTTDSYVRYEDFDNKLQSAKFHRLIANSNTTFKWDDLRVNAGLQYQKQQTENPTRAKKQANLSLTDMALFAEAEWNINDKTALTGGGRLVHDEHYGTKFVPRFYVVHHATPNLTVKGGVSAGYKTPDLKQGNSNWVEGGGGARTDGADIGNSNLKPESSMSYELGSLWEKGAFNAHVTAFYTDFKDKIEKPRICTESRRLVKDCYYDGIGYQGIWQYQNIDKAKLYGVELATGYRFNDVAGLKLNYTYNQSEQKTGTNKGYPLNNMPKHRVNAHFDWDVLPQLNVWTKWKYRSQTLETLNARTGQTNAYKGYHLFDMGGTYKFSDALNADFAVNNVANKQISSAEHGKYVDGRVYMLGLRWNMP